MSGAKVVCKSTFIAVSVAMICFLATGVTGHADLSGSWENDLYLDSGTNMLDKFSSELFLNYYSSGIDYISSSLFKKDSYYAQTFGIATSISEVDIDSTLDFEPQESRLNYFLAEAALTLADLNIENTFLLEYTGDDGRFGSGYELELSGELPGGPKMYVTNLFGMEENEAEALGIVRGSGYTIQTGNYGPSQFPYTSTTIEISAQRLDCCTFTSTTKFSGENGFEYSIFEFTVDSTGLLFDLGGKLEFRAQTKSVELNPKLDLDWACFEVYTDLYTGDDENLLANNATGTSIIEGLELEGFGISSLDLGEVTFSSLTALKGDLNRLTGQEDMDLRADDYVLDPDPIYSGMYTNIPYDEVISVEKFSEDEGLYFGADLYFDMSGSLSLFDIGLFTGVGSYDLSDQFTLGAGVAIKPDKLDAVRLSFDYYF